MSESSVEKRQRLLDEIRATESPGRGGGVFPYAKTVYSYFAEIQELTNEGFSMSTICRFFENKKILPIGADRHSFCRAYRRECSRRKRAAKETKQKLAFAKNNAAKQTDSAARVFQSPPQRDTGLRVNPDNTFVIRPIDTDDLPDIGTLR